ncbi:energy-coupling factor ABC transporter ATP-binding protein [bacterium]|nr:energy-coupling factor ABC transporter ATP-binding protein [bacterium]
MPCVDVRRLSFAYPSGQRVLQDISFSIHPCETLFIVGPNGAGKSTLLLHLNGVLPEIFAVDGPDVGVWVDGIKVRPDRLGDIRQRVGLIFQDPDDQLFCPTLLEDVMFGPLHLGLTRDAARSRAIDALKAVRLSGMEDRSPHQLSVGQQKRACLAGVLACGPKLLVMDEPTSHLDPRGRREWMELVISLAGPKIIATHDLELALEMATRVMVLDEGQIHADGLPRAILGDAALMERHGLEVPRSLRGEPLRDPSHSSAYPPSPRHRRQ